MNERILYFIANQYSPELPPSQVFHIGKLGMEDTSYSIAV